MARIFLFCFLVYVLAGCRGSTEFAGNWSGKIGTGKISLSIAGGQFTMSTVDGKGVERKINGTATPGGERRIVLQPTRIDGVAAGPEEPEMPLTMTTDGRQLQVKGLILERE